MRIYLTTTKEEKDIVKAAGAKYDPEIYKWWIDESQKSDPAFAKYLPTENKTIDFEPNPDWAPATEKQIFESMNSEIPNPFNHIKTYTNPEPEKEGASGDVPSPEILEPVIAEISPEIFSPEKPTKRTRGQIIDAEDSKIRKTYALNKEDIATIDRLSKYFKLNLSDTITKLTKIADQWIEENGKDAQIKKKDLHNEQLLEVIRKGAKVEERQEKHDSKITKLEEIIDKQNREIEALKSASTKNISTDIKNTNIHNDAEIDSMQKTITSQNKSINDLQEFMKKQAKWSADFTKDFVAGRELIYQLEKWIDITSPALGEKRGRLGQADDNWQNYKKSKSIANH